MSANYTVTDSSNGIETEGRTLEGRPFYLRAKWGDWTLTVGEPGEPIEEMYFGGRLVATGTYVGDEWGQVTATDVTAILDAHLWGLTITDSTSNVGSDDFLFVSERMRGKLSDEVPPCQELSVAGRRALPASLSASVAARIERGLARWIAASSSDAGVQS